MNETQKSQVVSYEEQKQLGLVRPSTGAHGARYVKAEVMKPHRPPPTAMQTTEHIISVPVQATQHIEVRTSSVDRAKGFLIAGVPLYAAFGVGMLIVAVALFGTPVLSLTGFLIFWLTFIVAWAWGYYTTLKMSAEGISLYEARRKWDVIEREQKERWSYYKQVNRD